MWQSGVGALDYQTICDLVNAVGLVDYGTTNEAEIAALLDQAVADLDKIIVSDDLGSLLGGLIKTTDATTGESKGFLGEWKYDYAYANPNGTRTQVREGQAITNLREFLISTILNLLWGGSLQTTIFKAINGAIGPAVYNLDQSITIIGDLWTFLPRHTRFAIPTMPHQFYSSNTSGVKSPDGRTDPIGGDDAPDWYRYFDGSAYQANADGSGGSTTKISKYDYTDILRVLAQAPIDEDYYGDGTSARSYWNEVETGKYSNGRRGIPNSAWEKCLSLRKT